MAKWKKPTNTHKWYKIKVDGEPARRCVKCRVVQFQLYGRWQQRFNSWEDAKPETRRCPGPVKDTSG